MFWKVIVGAKKKGEFEFGSDKCISAGGKEKEEKWSTEGSKVGKEAYAMEKGGSLAGSWGMETKNIRYCSHHDPVPVIGHMAGFSHTGGHRPETMGGMLRAVLWWFSCRLTRKVRVTSKK